MCEIELSGLASWQNKIQSNVVTYIADAEVTVCVLLSVRLLRYACVCVSV